MSRITQKLAVAIANEMVARVFDASIQHAEERLSDALTAIAKERIPKEVFEFVKNYREFITVTHYMEVTSIIGGKRVYLGGCINDLIPIRPLNYEIGEYTYKALLDYKNKILELRRNRADMHKRIFERIYCECGSIKKLEKDYLDAYAVMLDIEKNKTEANK